MDAIREQLNKPLVVGIASFVIGIFIGLVVLGWWLWPVEWVDAGPENLRIEFQEIYLRMAIDSYTLNQDVVAAQQRIAEVGPNAAEVMQIIQANPGSQEPDSIQVFVSYAGAVPTGTQIPPGTEGVVAEATPTTVGEAVVAVTPTAAATPPPPTSVARKLLPWMCLITFILALALVAFFLLRNRNINFKLPQLRKEAPTPAEYAEPVAAAEGPPLAQFMTTYQIGNDLYDDSFSIDSPAGEFLGECGVGISEAIGVGDPKRVTAFEVWLFDKNDIQTVTKVLMSEYAFRDDALRARLASKGEAVLAQPGAPFTLETSGLQVRVDVTELVYGEGDSPANSFFSKLTIELVAMAKAPEAGGGTF